MPKVRNAEEEARREMLAILRYYMQLHLMDMQILSAKAVIPYSTLTKRMRNPDTFTRAELRRVCCALHVRAEDKGKLL